MLIKQVSRACLKGKYFSSNSIAAKTFDCWSKLPEQSWKTNLAKESFEQISK